MMSYAWSMISKQGWSDMIKQMVFIVVFFLAFCILGFLCWLLIRRWIGSDLVTMICFVGYPGFFLGFLGPVLYLLRQDR